MEVDIEVKKLAIYVHIPFCKQKCKYCDFNSFCVGDEKEVEIYIKALIKQIEYYAKKSSEFMVSSVYFGGGTPSFIDEKYIREIFCIIKSNYSLLDNTEVTIEANPGTINFEKLSRYRELGINRISFGVQTLNDELLEKIGRVHSASDAIDSIYMARKAGFKNINLDIMFGLPSQTISDVRDTVNEFIKLDVEHISAYSLKVEENTIFGRLYEAGKLKLPHEDVERKMYYLIKDELKKVGYNQYEISNFSKTGYESRHNSAYWERQDYLGFGISAASCFNEVRFTNTNKFEEYIRNPIENFSEVEVLNKDIIDSEKIILGLRLLKGVSESLFFKDEWKKALEELIKKGLLIREKNVIALTDKGLDLANQVFVEFI